MPSAQNARPPSSEKLLLIRRFLKASGIQKRIDSGRFLEGYALGVSPILPTAGASMRATLDALRAAYEPHRQTFREEYEGHANWEFTESELQEIVVFLEGPAGQHSLEGYWRMDV